VFLAESTGVPKPGNEIKYLDFFNGSNLKVSNTTWEIIKLYNLSKKAEKEAAFARTKSANEPLK
jgi:hypothetical protein